MIQCDTQQLISKISFESEWCSSSVCAWNLITQQIFLHDCRYFEINVLHWKIQELFGIFNAQISPLELHRSACPSARREISGTTTAVEGQGAETTQLPFSLMLVTNSDQILAVHQKAMQKYFSATNKEKGDTF